MLLLNKKNKRSCVNRCADPILRHPWLYEHANRVVPPSADYKPWVSSQGGVVENVEPVVVGDRHVSVSVQEEGEHVVALL